MKLALQPACTPEHLKQISNLLRQAMQLLWGDLLNSEGMQETPERVARHWVSSTWGLHQSPAEPLQRTFPSEHGEIVLIRNIPFCSLCEHHLLPFFGVAHIAYLPQGRVVGLSKIPRCLDILAARPQMQENITSQLANIIHSTLNAVGTIVVLEAEHTCMATRGVLKAGAMTTTQAVLGVFKTDGVARAEVLTLIRSSS
ncbi:MAG: GTP cyclohydrolase I FolE [Stigonema ocellatum SAG 48.90 = DSM 106950]|nr:GTP cyclohydrolase I FolE [Stigonema ocellatum SAG 48.90 = DSM 106950]